MAPDFIKKGLNILLKRQTNILSAAFVIMGTTILSQLLGLFKKRLLVAVFGASNIVGVYDVATKFPDTLFQLIIAAAISSAFIPVFSGYLSQGKEKEGHEMASNLLTVGVLLFSAFSLLLVIFAPIVLTIFNPGAGFSVSEMALMVNLLRIIIVGQLIFVIGIFFSALLQSYNHFFIPGIAAATFNLGIIVGIIVLSPFTGIYSAAYGIIIGAIFYIIVQLPLVKKIGFSYKPNFSFKSEGVQTTSKLMWPRTLAQAIFQLGSLLIISLLSFLPDTGRNYVIFDLAQTLAFAPVALIGQAIAQAAFPVLAREKDRLEDFKVTFLTSFNQMFFLILPISALLLVLRIPIVRLVFGAPKLDWPATVLTGRTLAFFALSIFAQALATLIYRAFYALHDTKTPLIIGGITTVLMLILGAGFILFLHGSVITIALAYSIANLANFLVLFFLLERKVGGFNRWELFVSLGKTSISTGCMAVALYVPIKLLDRLVFDTTRTINLLVLTGISTIIGLSLYLFLTWLFDVKEAQTFLLLFKRLGNWREILGKSGETLSATASTH
ncbi:MAG: murein biosynthesis integral membrane protein MurJ [Patescibacteria group bacterium]|nr:murein biosynthesis integral membrane protein MurJ [Patescibacteria group bacterium]